MELSTNELREEKRRLADGVLQVTTTLLGVGICILGCDHFNIMIVFTSRYLKEIIYCPILFVLPNCDTQFPICPSAPQPV
jgi:hypothetical protein